MKVNLAGRHLIFTSGNNVNMNTKPKIELCTIQDLFEDTEKKLYIPYYHHAYVWKERDLKRWIINLQRMPQLYLGHIMLEKTNYGHAVIDGQQRLATSLIFLSTANENRFDPYFDNFSLGNADNDFFQNIIRNGTEREAQTLAQERIQEAHKYAVNAKKYLYDYTDISIFDLYIKLLNANIILNTIKDKQKTTFIFQLENNREDEANYSELERPRVDTVNQGKDSENMRSKLEMKSSTIQDFFEEKEEKVFIPDDHHSYAWSDERELGILKAYLMYEIQLCTENPEEKLAELAEYFDGISFIFYQLREDSESILIAHYQAFLTPNNNPYCEYSLDNIKAYFQGYKNKEKRIDAITEFCQELTNSFENIKRLEDKRIKEYRDTFRYYLYIPDYALPFILCEMKKRSSKNLKTLLKVLAELVVRHETVHFHEYGYDEDDAVGLDIKTYHRLGWILEKYRKERDPDLLSARLCQGFEGKYKEIEYNWRFRNFAKKIVLLWSKESYMNYINRGEYESSLEQFFLYQYEIYVKKGRVDWNEELEISGISSHWHDQIIGLDHLSYEEKRRLEDSIGNKFLLEKSLLLRWHRGRQTSAEKIYNRSKLAQANEIEKFTEKDKKDNEIWTVDAIKSRNKRLIEFIKKYYTPDESTQKLGMF